MEGLVLGLAAIVVVVAAYLVWWAARSQTAQRVTAFERRATKTKAEVAALAGRLEELPNLRRRVADAVADGRRSTATIAERGWRVDDIQADLDTVDADLAAVVAEPPFDLGPMEKELEAYVDENHHDLREKFGDRVRHFSTQLTAAQSSLDLDPPDRLGGMRAADGALEECEATTEAARSEVARMNKLRSEATKALGRAGKAVGDLDSYTSGFFADVFGSSRRTAVDRLRRRIAEADG